MTKKLVPHLFAMFLILPMGLSALDDAEFSRKHASANRKRILEQETLRYKKEFKSEIASAKKAIEKQIAKEVEDGGTQTIFYLSENDGVTTILRDWLKVRGYKVETYLATSTPIMKISWREQ